MVIISESLQEEVELMFSNRSLYMSAKNNDSGVLSDWTDAIIVL